jgi:hypothetical protein
MRAGTLAALATEQRAKLDLVGLGLLASAVVWTYASAVLAGGSPTRVALAFVATGAAFVIGRVACGVGRWIVPAAITATTLVLVAIFLRQSILGKALAGPLHYSNASAALYLQGTIAALVLALVCRRAPARAAAALAAVGLAAATLIADSRATDALLLLPAVALVLPRPAAVRIGLAAFAGLIVVALVGTVVLGATSPGARNPGSLAPVGSALSGNRLLLWHDALTLMEAHPVSGVGPERFQLRSPTARSDSDLRWAHNGFLQQGAEQGVTGLLLLLILFLWTLLRLGSVPHPDRGVALAGAAVAALGIQACVDYVLHFTALTVVAAALAGSVIASRAPYRFQEATAHERWLVGPQGR